MNVIIDLFNILIILVFFFNLFNLYKIFYKKGKIKAYYGDNYKTIPGEFDKRSFYNKLSMIFWAAAGLISAYQWYMQGTTDLKDPLFSVESFTLLSISLAVLRYFDHGEFSETKERAHIFYDDSYFTVNPFDKLTGLNKHYWQDLYNFELLDSQYKSYINILINMKDRTKYKLTVSDYDKDLITKELTKHLGFYKPDNKNDDTDN